MQYLKTCTKCNETKLIFDFYIRHLKTGKYLPRCKECYKLKRRIYYKNNREKVKATSQAWREKNKERCRAVARATMRRKKNAGH